MTQCDDRGMLLHYPWPQKGGARSDHREGIGLSFGTRRWQELEEIITHLAGLAWSRVGRTATRMESAQPTRLLAESGLLFDYCDIPIPGDQRVPLRFTFFWIVANLWEDGNFEVACTERDPGITK